jgi:hypothetical protein
MNKSVCLKCDVKGHDTGLCECPCHPTHEEIMKKSNTKTMLIINRPKEAVETLPLALVEALSVVDRQGEAIFSLRDTNGVKYYKITKHD